jgi:hypothetical protein
MNIRTAECIMIVTHDTYYTDITTMLTNAASNSVPINVPSNANLDALELLVPQQWPL